MRRLPDTGIVVLINTHREQCDALGLVAGKDKPIAIPLPDFSYEKADAFRVNLQVHLRTRGVRVRETRPSTRGTRPVQKIGIRAILTSYGYRL